VGAAEAVPAEPSRMPLVAWPVGLSNFLVGMSFAIVMSMLAISLEENFGFSPKEVGYTMTGAAIVMLIFSVGVAPFLQKKVGVVRTALFGSILNGVCLYMFSNCVDVVPALVVYFVSRAGSALCMASRGLIHASICDETNRGKVFGRMLFCMGLGRLAGPMFAGFVMDPRCGSSCADRDRWPWHIAAAANILSGCVLLVVPVTDKEASSPKGSGSRRPSLDMSGDLGERLIQSASSFDNLPHGSYASPVEFSEVELSASKQSADGSLAFFDLEATDSTVATPPAETPKRNATPPAETPKRNV